MGGNGEALGVAPLLYHDNGRRDCPSDHDDEDAYKTFPWVPGDALKHQARFSFIIGREGIQMAKQESHKFHFLPVFQLRPWCVGDELRGYWWDPKRDRLVCKRRGPKAFCFQMDLLSLAAHKLGRDALERVFFGEIDAKGAKAHEALISGGPESLSLDQRCDFTRLLLSLEVRRPATVERLRNGRQCLVDALDSDPAILEAMKDEGFSMSPSKFVEQELGVSLEDRALANIQPLVDNPRVGGMLINAYWYVVRLGPYDSTLVLGDRPLIWLGAHDHPSAIWFLPLTPSAAFVAANHPDILRRIRRVTPTRFAKLLNIASAQQAERFVFAVDSTHERWLGRYLCAAKS